MPPKDPAVNQYLDDLSGENQALARKLRALIFEVAPDALESFKWSRPVYENDRAFCYFQAAKEHVSLGFQQGAELDDPSGLLEGTGKLMRHVKLKPGEAFPEEEVRALLIQANRLA